MNVFILFDLEGITGYGCKNADRPLEEYIYSDLNAAIAGARAGGADQIVVGDWHACGGNLDKKKLDSGIVLEQYADRFRIPNHAIDCAFFIGAHAKAGTKNTVDPHTEEFFVKRALIDGTEAGEVSLIAYYFSAMKIPLGLVTGSFEATAEVSAVSPKTVTVSVKKGFESLSMQETKTAIGMASMQAVQSSRSIPLVFPKKNELIVEFTDSKRKVFTGPSFQKIYGDFTQFLMERMD